MVSEFPSLEAILKAASKDTIYYVKKLKDDSLYCVPYSEKYNPKNPFHIKKSMALLNLVQTDISIIGVITNGEFTSSYEILAKMQSLKDNNDFKQRIMRVKNKFARKMTKRELKVKR